MAEETNDKLMGTFKARITDINEAVENRNYEKVGLVSRKLAEYILKLRIKKKGTNPPDKLNKTLDKLLDICQKCKCHPPKHIQYHITAVQNFGNNVAHHQDSGQEGNFQKSNYKMVLYALTGLCSWALNDFKDKIPHNDEQTELSLFVKDPSEFKIISDIYSQRRHHSDVLRKIEKSIEDLSWSIDKEITFYTNLDKEGPGTLNFAQQNRLVELFERDIQLETLGCELEILISEFSEINPTLDECTPLEEPLLDSESEEGEGEKQVSIKPKSIDSNGVWHWDGKEIPLLGNHLPIPENVRLDMDPERQEILAIVDASDWMEGGLCACGAKAEGIILVTEFTKLFPAHCCNQMVWMTDEREFNHIYEN